MSGYEDLFGAMKIYSVRFYKGGKVMKDVVVSNDKDLKRSVKVSKEVGDLDKVFAHAGVRYIIFWREEYCC